MKVWINIRSYIMIATVIFWWNCLLICLPSSDINIVILTTASTEFGGSETHNVTLYKLLLLHGYKVIIMVEKGSKTEAILMKSSLPCATFSQKELAQDVLGWCDKTTANIVICTQQVQLLVKKELENVLKVKTILTMHMPMTKKTINFNRLKFADAIVCANQETLNLIRKASGRLKLNIKKIEEIYPFVDEEKFLTMMPQNNNVEFFSQFGIRVSNIPIVVVVANMYDSVCDCKNFPLLFRALKKINLNKKKIDVMIAGDGSKRPYFERMVMDMGLRDVVHFLGFVHDIPGLMFHSDIHVLPSKRESFGLVHIEAGLMKKPSIGAIGTGAEIILKHKETGLLFKNDNEDDLIDAIELLVDNPILCKQLGENAYNHVIKTFLNDKKLSKYEKIIKDITKAEYLSRR